MPKKFNYQQIQGIETNTNVTAEFIKNVEEIAARLKTKPEYLFAAISFETAGTFSPSIQNAIGATGLIQFLKNTAIALGTTTDRLKNMTATAQLEYVEKYFEPFRGKLNSLEDVYTTILSGAPKKSDDVLFTADTPAYKLNPLDWNSNGKITVGEATTVVAARMFGGVKVVQQKLLDAGFVPAKFKAGFVDGKWGANTSKILAAYQKTKRLPATGLIDEATGLALFPDSYKKYKNPESKILESGDTGEAVKKLQYDLITLGYLEMEKVGSGFGNFGLQTKTAVGKFQADLGLPITSKYGEIEQKAVANIQKGIARGNPNTQITKAIQNRLVKKGYLTKTQVNTGYGNYGLQTETAVKKFQTENKLQPNGIVETKTYKILFNQTAVAKLIESGEIAAKDGKYYKVAADILVTERLQKKVENLAEEYFKTTGDKLIVTSGYRPPERQAQAMYDKIVFEGEKAVRDLYANKSAIDEILNAFRSNKGNPPNAVKAITKTIENQTKQNPPIFISNHLLDNAVDVRKPTTDLISLQKAASKIGGRVIAEGDHYHIELS